MVVSSLMEHYKLLEKDCNTQISDSHLQKISQSCCKKWRSLPSYLKMEDIVASDIDYESKGEEEKRHAFFKQWKQKRGSNATYIALISALLEISCRQDAEKVCELLQKSFFASPARSGDGEAPDSRKHQEGSNSVISGNLDNNIKRSLLSNWY